VTSMLQSLAAGTRATVREIHGGRGLRRRLAAVGVHPGDTIEVLQAGADGGPVLIEIHGARVAIGHGQAERVEIEVTPDP
jgi:Fe2+ transport system protein FeoA